MSKITLNKISAPENVSLINDNFQKIAKEFDEKVLYRKVPPLEPNMLINPIDMNGQRLYNLSEPTADNEAARLIDVKDHSTGGQYHKTLRATDEMAELPPATDRKGKLVSFDGSGNPVVVLPASDSSTQLRIDLAEDSGYTLIGGLDDKVSPHLLDYAELRAYTGPYSVITIIDPYLSGTFSVTGSGVEDHGTLIVGVDGRKWKRLDSFPLKASWFGAKPGIDSTDAIQRAINVRAALGWNAGSDKIILDGSLQINGQVILTTDVELSGNWCTITSTSDNPIFVSGYLDTSGVVVPHGSVVGGISDAQVIAQYPLRGTKIKNITFSNVSKVFDLRGFTERCGLYDLYFSNCGLCWDVALGFYSEYRNIIIRGAKAGFEDWYAYQLRRASNQMNFYKVTISGRQYGRVIGDENATALGAIQPYYENLIFDSCTYEGMLNGSTITLSGYGLVERDWYAEAITGVLFKTTDGDHKDMRIEPASWCYGVENLGEFVGVSGRTHIYQSTQRNYTPSKRSSLFFSGGVAEVIIASDMGSTDYDSGINWTSGALIRLVGAMQVGTGRIDRAADGAGLPVTVSGKTSIDYTKTFGAKVVTYNSVSDQLEIATDIVSCENNAIAITLRWFETANSSNSYKASALLLNGDAPSSSVYPGNAVAARVDGGYITILIDNPAGGGSKSWLTSGMSMYGAIRLLK